MFNAPTNKRQLVEWMMDWAKIFGSGETKWREV